ncbi:MAG: OmpA family protein [Granulosicoccus sp.]
MNTSDNKSISPTHYAGCSLKVAAVACLALMYSGLGHTADATDFTERDTIFYSEPPTAEDLGQHLFPALENTGLTRGISFKESKTQSSVDKSVSMPVLFHFGKTSVIEESRPFLDRIGQMLLKPEYVNQKLVVEGHTDAVGTTTNNQRLSELRALAIKEYLVSQFAIDPYRLFPTGKGESRLIEPEAPTDRANRRVEFLPYREQ